jgi:thiol:disulfide interchange protein DsbD
MKFCKPSLLLVLIGWLSAAVCNTYSAAQSSASVVKVKPVLSVDKVRQGSSFQVAVVLDIDGGYHINSNRPTEKYLIPTVLKVERSSGISTSAVIYPKGKMRKFSFADKPLSVYEGRVVLRFVARALPTLSTGDHTIRARLTLQACNDQACLQPKTIEVAIAIEVVPASAKVNNINSELFKQARGR